MRDPYRPSRTAGGPADLGSLVPARWAADRYDVLAIGTVLALVLLAGLSARQMSAPLLPGEASPIRLDPTALPLYALRTTTRMLLALGASLLFTLTFATAAAKSRRAERVLIPLLDVLQSVPILGYLSFTITFFVGLFPGRMLGPELAAVFAIFTSQAWNMTFSFYQSLVTIPHDLDETSRSFRSSAWQRFWRLEVPFAIPGLVWNMMMSMSGGWFFVVASEAITVGEHRYTLPGIGAYVATAIAARDLPAIGWAILAMTVVIALYDQLLFRPLVVWADRFRFEQSASQVVPRSLVMELFRRSRVAHDVARPMGEALRAIARARGPRLGLTLPSLPGGVLDGCWYAVWIAIVAGCAWQLNASLRPLLGLEDVVTAVRAGCLTLLRVILLVVFATLLWVPVGVYVGLRPRLAEKVQPLAQVLAAFPANLLFPVAVIAITRYDLTPAIWLTPLMILGTQWYILFNVIAGATAFPTDFREAAESFRLRPWRRWTAVFLPAVFPYYVTGAITASGGAWNASIVAELVVWGSRQLDGGGLGSYIARMTANGDFAHIALGVTVMSAFVILMNRLLWRPLYAYAESRTRLD